MNRRPVQGASDCTNSAVEVFYDGACPLCSREIEWLRRCDRAGRIRFTDISDADFSPDRFCKSEDEFMSQLHVRDVHGQWSTGVEAFRKLYSAVGFGWIVWLTRWPGVSQALDAAYRVFARNRLRLTGRCNENCASNSVSKKPLSEFHQETEGGAP